MIISQNGVARCKVVVAGSALAPDRQAADELVRLLGQVTGGSFELVHAKPAQGHHIYVGAEAAGLIDAANHVDGIGEGGIVIKSIGEDLVIAGGAPRGTLYAVYTFLEAHVGCRWWTPAAATIPRKPNLTIESLDVRYEPKLELRDIGMATEPDWCARNKVNGPDVEFDERHGGPRFTIIAHNKWHSGTFWTIIPPNVYFKDHPEYFSEIDGKRVHTVPQYPGTSLCLTNDEMRKEFVHNARLALQWHPWANLFSISQIDDSGEPNRCMCGPCTAIEREDNPSGLIVRFVNSVAADLKQHFPDMTFDTLAYHYSQAPPKVTRARDDVLIRLCPIKVSHSTPIRESRDDDPLHNQFRDDLAGWSKMANRIVIWDYAVNFTYHPLPHPNLRVYGPNIRYYVDHHVTGLFQESDTPFCELRELRTWLLAKLMWDPNQDSDALIAEFCDGYYGPAGKHVAAYINTTHDAVEASGDYLGLSSGPDAKFLSFDTLSKCWSHLQSAAKAVEHDRTLRARIKTVQLSVLYAFLMKWDELRDQANAAGATWPVPGSMQDVHGSIVRIARQNGINLKSTSSAIPF
ncbi:MAG: DUF4838 domain-containing protein [Phycisphaeraceae bacterium]|nr:DUF4838 domain-containing protein [Phycisphaeraceae bacterium]